jgi:DNA-binding XRE family transcriptional regulator
MKINAELVLELRGKKFWSQDELAIAAGLNLRTIQRIEKEASASLRSRKAIACALDIDTLDLEYKELKKMKQYEYRTLEIESNEGFLTGIKKQKLPDLTGIFNKEGREGWLVVQILTPELAQGVWSAKTGNMLALMQREIFE